MDCFIIKPIACRGVCIEIPTSFPSSLHWRKSIFFVPDWAGVTRGLGPGRVTDVTAQVTLVISAEAKS